MEKEKTQDIDKKREEKRRDREKEIAQSVLFFIGLCMALVAHADWELVSHFGISHVLSAAAVTRRPPTPPTVMLPPEAATHMRNVTWRYDMCFGVVVYACV